MKSRRSTIKMMAAYVAVPVVAFTRDGEYIGDYLSAHHAERELKLPEGSVTGVISGRNLSCGPKKTLFVLKSKYTPGMKITYASLLRKREFLKARK